MNMQIKNSFILKVAPHLYCHYSNKNRLTKKTKEQVKWIQVKKIINKTKEKPK